MERLKEIEDLFDEGLSLNQGGDVIGGCDKWLEAWEIIKELFAEGYAKDIHDLDKKQKWGHYPFNYVQYLEMELHNAGIEDSSYHKKRIEYCKELLQWCGSDELLTSNTKVALGEAYYFSGDETSGGRLFEEWAREDPDNGWCYAGWADCLLLMDSAGNHKKAESILLDGYARGSVRERDAIGERLCLVYEEMGERGKAEEYRKYCPGPKPVESHDTQPSKQRPVRVAKIGRNEPCPCGSGKKYKKCCGA